MHYYNIHQIRFQNFIINLYISSPITSQCVHLMLRASLCFLVSVIALESSVLAMAPKKRKVKAKGKKDNAPTTKYHQMSLLREKAKEANAEAQKKPAAHTVSSESGTEDSSSSEIRDKDKTYHFKKFLDNGDLAETIVEVSL